jgi:endoglucanase
MKPLLAEFQSKADVKGQLSWYGKSRWNKEKLAARVRQALAWGAEHHVPLYCDEFGVFAAHSQAAARTRWFHDFGEVLAESQVGWAVWGWEDGFGLRRKLVGGKRLALGQNRESRLH